MKHDNIIEFSVWGERALFSDPLTTAAAGRATLPVPTYEALKGIISSVYWKPTLIWIVDKVRVMNQIRSEAESVVLRRYRSQSCELAVNTYLCDVRYHVQAHFIWNENRPEFKCDRCEEMHYSRAKRMLSRGGARQAFLGTRDCPCYVAPCRFSVEHGYYDDTDLDIGIIHHGFTYPDEAYNARTRCALSERLFHCRMEKGIIEFPPPWQCIHRHIGDRQAKEWNTLALV
ncbi:MAG: type I-C CRISPR-associated protein Cas5 [Oscillospiraceae bacterium]|nr:type I-C CRISPR-associated protein Cas5 [Oscillospiraceae bacterium]